MAPVLYIHDASAPLLPFYWRISQLGGLTRMKIRKQVYALTPDDLAQYPIWEFALDEEGEEDQDEATVRPFTGSDSPDPAEGMFIVRGQFTLADGTIFPGYLTPAEDSSDLGTVQPQIVSESGQVGFWLGMSPREPGGKLCDFRKVLRRDFPDSLYIRG